LHNKILEELFLTLEETKEERKVFEKNESFQTKMRLLRQLQILERELEKPLVVIGANSEAYQASVANENEKIKVRNFVRQEAINKIRDKAEKLGFEDFTYQDLFFEDNDEASRMLSTWNSLETADDISLQKEATYGFLNKIVRDKFKELNDIQITRPLAHFQQFVNSETSIIEDVLRNLKGNIIDMITPEKRFCIFASYVILNNYAKAKRLSPYRKKLYLALIEFLGESGFHTGLEVYDSINPMAIKFVGGNVKFYSAYLLTQVISDLPYLGIWRNYFLHGTELPMFEVLLRFKILAKELETGKLDFKPIIGVGNDSEYMTILKLLLQTS
jgi:hypothetical protein